LPKLNAVLTHEQTVWQTITVDNWYGHRPTQVEITSNTAVWYHSGMPAVPIRWVLIRDPNQKFETRALLCTDQSADPLEILTWFVRRRQVEVTFQEVRAHLGVNIVPFRVNTASMANCKPCSAVLNNGELNNLMTK